MVDKNSAPSYSIGGPKKSSFIKDNGLPGPGAYETISYLQHKESRDKYNACNVDCRRGNDLASMILLPLAQGPMGLLELYLWLHFRDLIYPLRLFCLGLKRKRLTMCQGRGPMSLIFIRLSRITPVTRLASRRSK